MKMFFYTILTTLTLVSLYLIFRPRALPVEAAIIQKGLFEETLATEGKVRAKNRQIVYAFANGNLSLLRVKVGDEVNAGQTVGELDWDKVTKVQSPINGVITKIYRDSAGPISRGEPIFEVSDVNQLEVVVELLTPEAVRLSMDGKATILNWGGSNQLSAQIYKISKAGAVKVSALGVEEEKTEVKLNFLEVPETLKNKLGDNYHVDVIFTISQDPQSIIVPLGALFRDGDSWAVYKIADGKAYRQLIKILKRNDKFAQATEGLNANDQVILFPGDKVRNGLSVDPKINYEKTSK